MIAIPFLRRIYGFSEDDPQIFHILHIGRKFTRALAQVFLQSCYAVLTFLKLAVELGTGRHCKGNPRAFTNRTIHFEVSSKHLGPLPN